MKKDQIFETTASRATDFEFNDAVANVFDDMIVRSVPFYFEQQQMIKEIVKQFWIPGTLVYDLGCSTSFTLINLCSALEESAHLIGYDNSRAMLDKAMQKVMAMGLDRRIELRYGDLNGNLSDIFLENASAVTMCWTLQFVRPLWRDHVIRWIYDSLVENGVLIVTEKILTNSTLMNRLFIKLYYDFKRRNGYSEMEILRKREALENVLIPYRIEENLDLFKRNGFEIIETFFQWYNFSGFLCVKKPMLSADHKKKSTLNA